MALDTKDMDGILYRLSQLEIEVQNLKDGITEVINIAPIKPRSGIYYAYGAPAWDPGSGRGFYRYDDSALTWHYLG